MSFTRLAEIRARIVGAFKERHVYIRSEGRVHGWVLTVRQQVIVVALAGGIASWALISTVGMLTVSVVAFVTHQSEMRQQAELRRNMAAHDAKIIATVDGMARSRTERLNAALKLAGVDVLSNAGRKIGAEGGPLLTANLGNAAAQPTGLDASRHANAAEQAATDVATMRILTALSTSLPLGRPTATSDESSGFGVRRDPFTRSQAFHPGLDFPAPKHSAVYATAPGVVSFTGARNGYGNTIEIDHGHGLKTRFGHLASISVSAGQAVQQRQIIGGIGSTGRSTGAHLHYEIWKDGRLQDPEKFIKAGDFVQQGQ